MKEILMIIGMLAFFITTGVFFILWRKERANSRLNESKLEEATKEAYEKQKIADEKEEEITRLKNRIKSDLEQSINVQNRLKTEYDQNILEVRSENNKLNKEILEINKALRESEEYARNIGMMALSTTQEYNDLLREKERIEKELEELKAQEWIYKRGFIAQERVTSFLGNVFSKISIQKNFFVI